MLVSLGDAWSSGGKYYQVINLYVSDLTTTAIPVPWTLTATNSAYTSLSQVGDACQQLVMSLCLHGKRQSSDACLHTHASSLTQNCIPVVQR